MDDPVKGIISDYLTGQDDDGWHETKPGLYHASSVFSCRRQQYYGRKGLPAKKPLGLFEQGRSTQERFHRTLVKKYGAAFVREELPIRIQKDEYAIIGKADESILDFNLKVRRLYEVKSAEGINEEKSLREGPMLHHAGQVSLYAFALKPVETRIVRIERGDLESNVEHALSDAELRQYQTKAFYYFDALHRILESGELPPAEPVQGWECNYCSFKTQCIKDGGWKEVQIIGKDKKPKMVWKREADLDALVPE